MGCGICRYLAAVSIFIAVGLSLTAVTSSNWSEYYQDKNTTNQLFDTNLMVKATKGLWKLCAVRGTQRGCWNVNVGLKIATKRGVETDQPYWKICQASEVLAVITSIIAFILWTCCFTCSKNGTAKSVKCTQIITCVLCIISALFQAAAVTLWIVKERPYLEHFSTYWFSWSLYVAAIAGCADLLAFTFVVISQPPMDYRQASQY